MKIYPILITLLAVTNLFSQSEYRCRNVVEKSGNTYCKIYSKCGPFPQKLTAEGSIALKGYTLKRNYHLYRHGTWIFYDSSGSEIPVDTMEFYFGYRLGKYEFTDPATDKKVEYVMVAEGNSVITYYDEKGRKTQENIFNLNEKKMKTYKKFYDRKGNLIREETWMGKRILK
jgi:hypothetical protein